MVSLARKNWLFFGSDHGGDRVALLYSKLNGVDFESYMQHLMTVIADWPVTRVPELLLWNIIIRSEVESIRFRLDADRREITPAI